MSTKKNIQLYMLLLMVLAWAPGLAQERANLFAPGGRDGIGASNNYFFGLNTANPERQFVLSTNWHHRSIMGLDQEGEPGIFISRWTGTSDVFQSMLMSARWNGSGYGLAIASTGNHNFNDWNAATIRMYISQNGNVGIGTMLESNPYNYRLAVNGAIGARSVRVEEQSAAWPDYVFRQDYRLMPLEEVERFIKEQGHLPEVPSEAEVGRDGIDLGMMDATLLKKIEELTLYLIEVKKENEALKKQNLSIEDRLNQLQMQLAGEGITQDKQK